MNDNVETMLERVRCVFDLAIEKKYPYVAVAIQIEDNPELEIIINKTESLPMKKKYYENTYKEDGTHNHVNSIKIVDVDYSDYVDEMKFFKE